MTALSVGDRVEIDALVAAYADVVNRRAWSELADLFLPDAVIRLDLVTRPPVEVVGPHEFGRFVGAAVERFDFFEFVRLTSHLMADGDSDADRVRGRLWMCEVRHEARDDRWSSAYGLYRDAYVRRGGRWWFASRDYRSLARTGPDSIVLPFPETGSPTEP